MDVSDREGMFSAVAGLPDEFSQTEVLVNNAGLANTVSDTAGGNVDDWEQIEPGFMLCPVKHPIPHSTTIDAEVSCACDSLAQ